VVRKKSSRKQLLAYTANLQSSLVGIEACSGAHFIGAALRSQGHDVRLIPAQFVKPYVKSNKNDFLDAEAIAEAVARQNMRFVPIKTEDQLDLQALHRVRDRLVHRRTAIINQIRGFLLERGVTFAKGPANLRNRMPAILEDAEQNISPRMRIILARVWQGVEASQPFRSNGSGFVRRRRETGFSPAHEQRNPTILAHCGRRCSTPQRYERRFRDG
jgi:transposase